MEQYVQVKVSDHFISIVSSNANYNPGQCGLGLGTIFKNKGPHTVQTRDPEGTHLDHFQRFYCFIIIQVEKIISMK